MVEHGPHGDVGPPVHGADGMHVVAVAVSGAERVQRPSMHSDYTMQWLNVVGCRGHINVRSRLCCPYCLRGESVGVKGSHGRQ